MKQVLVKGGGVIVDEVPAPEPGRRAILVRVHYSCVSVGTELSTVQLSGMPLYRRALKQPHHAKRALEVAREQGMLRTYKRISGQLSAGTPTGYSAAGVVVGLGEDVDGFAVGDRVACAGAGIANHAEVIAVPVNLAARVPDHVELDDASTVTLGAIAMQGVRRVEPTLGETVAVVGLGVIGQLTVQLLRAAGCRVLGADPDSTRAEQALLNGATWVVQPGESLQDVAARLTDGFGVDAVVITAATSSSAVVSDAFQACRRKGRVVIVGDVGLELKRHDMYEKELDLRMSTSYGPGRYDPVYEEQGADYPYGYVRWTEGRNLEEYLRLLADGSVTLAHLATRHYPIDDAPAAYAALTQEEPKPTLVVLEYESAATASPLTQTVRTAGKGNARPGDRSISVGLVGAGSFAEAVHVPNLRKLSDDFELRAVMSRTGSTAKAMAVRNEATYATTDFDELLNDNELDLILIATRHDLHAPLALRALEAGKHVFVEKPLALTELELEAIERFYQDTPDGPVLMTGFNRRFSPAVRLSQTLLRGRAAPLVIDYRMNAGYIPLDHWVHGPEGGGRNIGEACHVYDVFDAIVGGGVERITASSIKPTPRLAANDNFATTITYVDGSICTLTYTALGAKDHPKERMEIYADGKVITLDDYQSLSMSGRKAPLWSSRTTDKGHRNELESLADCLRRNKPWPISLEEQLQATRISHTVERRLREPR
jgi:predicted dehydrogenase/threonine dehydrogenase-like Zn-dependent dehydrogenase